MSQALPLPNANGRRVEQDVLLILDYALPIVLMFKLSGAWLHQSFTPSDTAPGLALVNALFLAFCLYGTLRLLFTRPTALLSNPAYGAFLLFAAASLWWSVSPSNSMGMLRTAFLFFGACLFIRHRFSPAYITRLLVTVLGVLLLLSAAAALLTPIGVMPGFDAGRWRGLFNHKNTLGENAAVTLIVALGLSLTTKDRLLPILAALVSAMCLLKSGSATALAAGTAACLILLLAWLIVRLRIIPQQGLWLLLGTLAGLALAGLAIMAPLAATLGRDLTFTGRTEIWHQFLHFAHQRPWSGWGWATISTTDHMLPIIRQTLSLPHIQTPHSGYLSLLVELGYPGLLLFVGWLALTLVRASRSAVIERNGYGMILLAIACALAIHSAFESTSGALPSLWLLLLFALGPRITIRWR
ncbi:O-antigen ligase family protein [Devosia submarina]|uniref:O-antigen ligase family protein n=1 Tax=Devosia submarina TaxID=1173082 RepID=UPI000D3C77E6|nr:O-antigen ligase family protein [Devosia submarina]